MTYRELAEMIEVLLTEEQKDQTVIYHDPEYGIRFFYDLKVSGNVLEMGQDMKIGKDAGVRGCVRSRI